MEDRDQGLTTAEVAGSGSSESLVSDGSDEDSAVRAGEGTSERVGEDDRFGAGGNRPGPVETPGRWDGEADAPLLAPGESKQFSDDWRAVQGEFVDRPREAVEQADRLVADLMQRLASQFSETRANLERQWDGQDDISTEELRVAMTRYRSFFERLRAA